VSLIRTLVFILLEGFFYMTDFIYFNSSFYSG